MTMFFLPETLKDYDDVDTELLLKTVEAQIRKLRREMEKSNERETMDALRACLKAERKNLLEFYFLAEEVEGQINWVHLEALHLIKRLDRPFIPKGDNRAMFQHTYLQWVFNNGQPMTKPFLPDPEAFKQQEELRSKWFRGTPYVITERGNRSLAQGYIDYGVTIGEISNGLDGQWVVANKEPLMKQCLNKIFAKHPGQSISAEELAEMAGFGDDVSQETLRQIEEWMRQQVNAGHLSHYGWVHMMDYRVTITKKFD